MKGAWKLGISHSYVAFSICKVLLKYYLFVKYMKVYESICKVYESICKVLLICKVYERELLPPWKFLTCFVIRERFR